jgi:hypothetical protein
MKLNPCERLNQAIPPRGDDIIPRYPLVGNLQRQFAYRCRNQRCDRLEIAGSLEWNCI